MRSQQCGLRSITLDNLPGTKYGDRHDVRGMAEQTEGQTRYSTQTWGQARCPVYRSGTLNVKRSTLNF